MGKTMQTQKSSAGLLVGLDFYVYGRTIVGLWSGDCRTFAKLLSDGHGSIACELAHSGGEQLGAAHDILELGVLCWVVTDARAARDEEHGA